MLDYNSHKNRFFHCNFFSRSFHYIYTFQTSLSVLIILILSRRIFSKMLPDESELAFCARNPFDQSWKISSYQAPRHCSGGVVFGSVFPWKKQHFIHHSTLRNVMLWNKVWRKRAFGKKKTDFRVSRFAISLKKKNNNNKNDSSKTKTKKQRELKKNRKSSHEETALVMSCLTERKFPLPFTNVPQEYCF